MADIEFREDLLRSVPHSNEAEQAVLGAILVNPDKINDISGILKADDFYLSQHQHIYEAMQDLMLRSKTIDVVTLLNNLVEQGDYTESGGKDYIKYLAASVPSVSNIKDYAKIVKDKSLLRRLSDAADEIKALAVSAEGETEGIIDLAESKIFAIAQGADTKNFVHIRDAIISNYEHLKLLNSDKEAAMGVRTYFSSIDKLLVGMGYGDLVLIGARPGMGKTSFALCIATNIAAKTKKTVCIFSLEMSAEQLVSRMLCSEALIDSYKMRSGELNEDDWLKLSRTSAVLSETNILIDDTTGITVTGMKAKLRRVKNLGLVVIDYLQLMQADKKTDNRVQEVADISRNLKLLAKELGVPVICCAQLSRGPESRTDKTPMLSDLRDSGAIEQDADSVMLLYRDDYYKNGQSSENQNIAECSIAKNRHGATGKVKLGWYGQYTKFIEIDNHHNEQ